MGDIRILTQGKKSDFPVWCARILPLLPLFEGFSDFLIQCSHICAELGLHALYLLETCLTQNLEVNKEDFETIFRDHTVESSIPNSTVLSYLCSAQASRSLSAEDLSPPEPGSEHRRL